ncbi:MAG TPA: DUF5412 family protein [Blastocatellia bacterium]|nr:DUF5412 family protein [Blastocatellia bacterium]
MRRIGLTGLLVILIAPMLCRMDRLCSDDLKREVRSPDRKYVVAAFERNCGATTDFVQHVSLRAESAQGFKTTRDGTITDGEVFVAEGSAKVEVVWTDGATVLVTCSGAKRVFRRDGAWGFIRINYDVRDTQIE